nr:toxin ArtA [Escherichia coli]
MKKLSFKEKLEIVRNIIRESLSGNAAFALLVYSLLHSLPIKTFADLFVTILLFIAIIAVVIWLFLIIYVYFCELFRSHWIAVWFILWSVVINLTIGFGIYWICPYISRHLLSLNPLLACCRRYSRGER